MESAGLNGNKSKLNPKIILLTILIAVLLMTVIYLVSSNYEVDEILMAFESNNEYTISLDEFLLNIKSEIGTKRYLKTTMAIMYTDKKQSEYIESNISRIRDVILSTLRNKTYEEILDNDNINNIKSEIIKNLNNSLKEDIIKDLYITDLIVQ